MYFNEILMYVFTFVCAILKNNENTEEKKKFCKILTSSQLKFRQSVNLFEAQIKFMSPKKAHFRMEME